mgnify:CR=1 FL=1
MPKYTVKPLDGGEEYDIECKSNELDEILKTKGLVKVLKFPGVIAHHGSLLSKTDNGWKDNLKRIKQASGKGNTIKV